MNSASRLYSLDYIQEVPVGDKIHQYSLMLSFESQTAAQFVYGEMCGFGLPVEILDNHVRILSGNEDKESRLIRYRKPGVHRTATLETSAGFIKICFPDTDKARNCFNLLHAYYENNLTLPIPYFEDSSNLHAVYFPENNFIPERHWRRKALQVGELQQNIYLIFALQNLFGSNYIFPMDVIKIITGFNVANKPTVFFDKANLHFPLSLSMFYKELKRKHECYVGYAFSDQCNFDNNTMFFAFSNTDQAEKFSYEFNNLTRETWFNGEIKTSVVKRNARVVSICDGYYESVQKLILSEDKSTFTITFKTAIDAENIHAITHFKVLDKDNKTQTLKPVLEGDSLIFPLSKMRQRDMDKEMKEVEGFYWIQFCIKKLIAEVSDSVKAKLYISAQSLKFWMSADEIAASNRMQSDLKNILEYLAQCIANNISDKSLTEIVDTWRHEKHDILQNPLAQYLDISLEVDEIVKKYGSELKVRIEWK